MFRLELNHEHWMKHAIRLAKRAFNEGEVPVGAVLVHNKNNKMISEGWNQSISRHDPTAHAEIIALRIGGLTLKNYRLLGCTLYVTLEPCIMCSGALIHGRLDKVVYGASTKRNKNTVTNASLSTINSTRKSGSLSSLLDDALKNPMTNHQVEVISGVLSSASSEILNDFFQICRLRKKEKEIEK